MNAHYTNSMLFSEAVPFWILQSSKWYLTTKTLSMSFILVSINDEEGCLFIFVWCLFDVEILLKTVYSEVFQQQRGPLPRSEKKPFRKSLSA